MPLSNTAQIPFYKQARNLTSVKIWAGNAVNGVVTWGTPVELAVYAGGTLTFESFSLSLEPQDVELTPSDALVVNMVTERENFSATVSEIAPANGSGNLNLLAATYDYFRVVAVYKAKGSSDSTASAVGVVAKRGALSTGIQAGKNVDTLNLVPCGTLPYIGPNAAIAGI